MLTLPLKCADEFLEDFIKQNLFPLALPITYDTLKSLGDDERKIVLTIVEDEDDEKSKKLIKILKSAASANHDLVFGYVGVKQWDDFADTFGANKKTKLPKMVIWNRNEDYLTVSSLLLPFFFLTHTHTLWFFINANWFSIMTLNPIVKLHSTVYKSI